MDSGSSCEDSTTRRGNGDESLRVLNAGTERVRGVNNIEGRSEGREGYESVNEWETPDR